MQRSTLLKRCLIRLMGGTFDTLDKSTLLYGFKVVKIRISCPDTTILRQAVEHVLYLYLLLESLEDLYDDLFSMESLSFKATSEKH